ncbi:hypothetical protein MZK49_02980 [Ensifer sesbaniae]|jgi:hypothetical protein|uniref:hypothetical protein n=1 Tax=Ensifer sesbaniae TaxID=1214071 RepID=UPI00156996A4|nr:hypothetical protein [Ensifer sesbaniae]MCK3775692.1 hypothetical protein [Ensifer sesbaniae]
MRARFTSDENSDKFQIDERISDEGGGQGICSVSEQPAADRPRMKQVGGDRRRLRAHRALSDALLALQALDVFRAAIANPLRTSAQQAAEFQRLRWTIPFVNAGQGAHEKRSGLRHRQG